MSLNFPELWFPHLKNGDDTCLLELLHQLNEIICNLTSKWSANDNFLFSAFIHTQQ